MSTFVTLKTLLTQLAYPTTTSLLPVPLQTCPFSKYHSSIKKTFKNTLGHAQCAFRCTFPGQSQPKLFVTLEISSTKTPFWPHFLKIIRESKVQDMVNWTGTECCRDPKPSWAKSQPAPSDVNEDDMDHNDGDDVSILWCGPQPSRSRCLSAAAAPASSPAPKQGTHQPPPEQGTLKPRIPLQHSCKSRTHP